MKNPSLRLSNIPQESHDQNPSHPGSKTNGSVLRGFMEEVGFQFTLKAEQDFHNRDRKKKVNRRPQEGTSV